MRTILALRILKVVGVAALVASCDGRDDTNVGPNMGGNGGDAGAGGTQANGGSGGDAGSAGGGMGGSMGGTGGDAGSGGTTSGTGGADPIDAGRDADADGSAPDATPGDADGGDAGELADAGDSDAGDAATPPTTAELCAQQCALETAFHNATPCDQHDETACTQVCTGQGESMPPGCVDEYDAMVSCFVATDSWACQGSPSEPDPTPTACVAEQIALVDCLS